MLNPSHAEDVDQKARKRSAAQLEESGTEGFPSSGLGPPTMTASSGRSVSGDPSHALHGTLPRILTPPLPALHRASVARIVTGNVQAGTIGVQQSPFLPPTGSRIHTVEPGSAGVPHLPVPPDPHRSALPSAQASGLALSRIATLAPGSLDLEHSSGIPVVSSGPNTYQLMAIPTGKGPVQILVDTNAASRVADKKRKRNAGASARFRQRRKDKEREASTRISGKEREASTRISENEREASARISVLERQKGPVQIPVDTKAASRVADEKRKRNAGASARFRQRRKEKEQEAATRIGVLERQLEWYKKEHQELLIALQALPGGERYLPREKSPRSREQSVDKILEVECSAPNLAL